MEIYGYKVDEPTSSKAEWVLLNAPLLLDEARYDSVVWRKVQKRYSEFEKRSQRRLNRFFRGVDAAVQDAYQELTTGEIELASLRLKEYNPLGIGVFRLEHLSQPMAQIEEFQGSYGKGGAYDCHAISDDVIYLCVWVDRP